MINAAYHFSLSPGTVVEEYRIISVLGQGSFGVTYLAEDVNLGARLAIKEYLPGDWAFRDSTQTVRPKNNAVSENFERGQDAFLKEARLLAQVVHPNIVKVRRFFRAHGTAYIAMDFISGRSLGDMLNEDYRTGGYPSAALKRLLIAVLDGLAALHAVRIIHRDIKPGNVVIEPSGNPMLVDFGAARNFDPAVVQGMTVIVTPGYAPIEQYSDDGEQGPFTDIYALGALAYRAITGHPPDAPYKRLGSNSWVPATIAGAGKYPAPILAAVDWALAVQPQDRPQSAEALLTKLRAAPDEVPQPLVEPTQMLGEATQLLDTSRWRSASKGKGGGAGAEASLRRGDMEILGAPREPASRAPAMREAAVAASPRRRKLLPLLVASVVCIAAIGAAAYYVIPHDHGGSTTADQDAAAARAEAARQAAARAEAERRTTAAAAQQKADQAAEAARAEAARQAAAKAEADRQTAAKAEADRQAAAKAEADRQAAAKAEADREAAAKADADRQAAAKADADQRAAAKAEADRQAAKAEADRKAAAATAARLKAERDAAEAARQKAARDAAARAEEQRAAAAAAIATPAPPKRVKVRPVDAESSSSPGAARCSSILQDAQLKGEISDDDKTYLREHCH